MNVKSESEKVAFGRHGMIRWLVRIDGHNGTRVEIIVEARTEKAAERKAEKRTRSIDGIVSELLGGGFEIGNVRLDPYAQRVRERYRERVESQRQKRKVQ